MTGSPPGPACVPRWLRLLPWGSVPSRCRDGTGAGELIFIPSRQCWARESQMLVPHTHLAVAARGCKRERAP